MYRKDNILYLQTAQETAGYATVKNRPTFPKDGDYYQGLMGFYVFKFLRKVEIPTDAIALIEFGHSINATLAEKLILESMRDN